MGIDIARSSSHNKNKPKTAHKTRRFFGYTMKGQVSELSNTIDCLYFYIGSGQLLNISTPFNKEI